mgnify:CR=1 FL=1
MVYPYSPEFTERLKRVLPITWDPKNKVWGFSFSDWGAVYTHFHLMNIPYTVSTRFQEAEQAYRDVRARHRRAVLEWKAAPEKLDIKGLWPHQQEGAAFLLKFPRAALFDEMGLGKTRQVLTVMKQRFSRGDIHKALILCPATHFPIWRQEIEEYAPEFVPFLVLFRGLKDSRLNAFAQAAEETFLVGVANYEMLAIPHYIEALGKIPFDLIVADEIHRVGNPTAKRTKSFFQLFSTPKAKYRIALTGTPIRNSPLDAWTILKWLDPEGVENFYHFRSNYAVFREKRVPGKKPVQFIVGYQNLTELEDRLSIISLRRRKEDVMPFLPPIVFQRYAVEMREEQAELYDEWSDRVAGEITAGLASGDMNRHQVLEKIVRLAQIADSPFLVDESYPMVSGKAAFLLEMLPAWKESHNQIVVWCRFVGMLRALQESLSTLKLGRVGLVYGEVSQTKREKIIQDFRSGKISLLVANPQVAGEGFSFPEASLQVFFDNSFSYNVRKQAIHRLHRGTTTHTVFVVDLVSEKTIDEYILLALSRKDFLAKLLVDGEVKGSVFDGISLSKLVKIIKREENQRISGQLGLIRERGDD